MTRYLPGLGLGLLDTISEETRLDLEMQVMSLHFNSESSGRVFVMTQRLPAGRSNSAALKCCVDRVRVVCEGGGSRTNVNTSPHPKVQPCYLVCSELGSVAKCATISSDRSR